MLAGKRYFLPSFKRFGKVKRAFVVTVLFSFSLYPSLYLLHHSQHLLFLPFYIFLSVPSSIAFLPFLFHIFFLSSSCLSSPISSFPQSTSFLSFSVLLFLFYILSLSLLNLHLHLLLHTFLPFPPLPSSCEKPTPRHLLSLPDLSPFPFLPPRL